MKKVFSVIRQWVIAALCLPLAYQESLALTPTPTPSARATTATPGVTPTRTPRPRGTPSPRVTATRTPTPRGTARPTPRGTRTPKPTPVGTRTPVQTPTPKVTPRESASTAEISTVYGFGGKIGVELECGGPRGAFTAATAKGSGELSKAGQPPLYAELNLKGERDLRYPDSCVAQYQTFEGSLTLSTVAKPELRTTDNTVVDRNLQCGRQGSCRGTLSQLTITTKTPSPRSR